MVYVMLILGFLLLIKGADLFVEGSSSVAKILHVPSMIIGLTVVAFGTSMPEAAVSITASIKGANDLAISNIIGSNIFNLLVVLGSCAIIHSVHAKHSVIKQEFPFSIIITFVLLILLSNFAFTDIISGTGTYTLGRMGGILLLILFIIFLVSTVRDALKARSEYQSEGEEDYKVLSTQKSAVFILIGIAGICWGGDLVVDSATAIAKSFGLSQTLIGLTIVALGTSLPELVTSIVASSKGENDLAIGNVIGSNIFNILMILGVSSLISPIEVDITAIYDTAILAIVSVIGYICTVKQKGVSKKQGFLFIGMYLMFFVYIL
ncbi:MAG: calcium/sodium antiporter, partial [Lachnospiraceae bacterium]